MRFGFAFLLLFAVTPVWAEGVICHDRDAASCLDLAWQYDAGYPPFPRDRAAALKIEAAALLRLEEQCRAKEWEACLALYDAINSTISDETSYTAILSALQLWQSVTERGCADGSVRACAIRSKLVGLEIGFYYKKDGKTPPTRDAARDFQNRAKTLFGETYSVLRDACWSGGVDACDAVLRDSLSVSASGVDVTEVIETALIGCKLLPEACETMLESAAALAKAPAAISTVNTRELRHSLEKSCNDAIGAACLTLAILSDDEITLVSMLEHACVAGSAEGCLRLGRHGYYEYTRTQNLSVLQQATDWLERACTGGKVVACHMLNHIDRQ